MKESSAVKNTCYSSRGSRISCQYPHGSTQPSLTPIQEIPCPLLISSGKRHTHISPNCQHFRCTKSRSEVCYIQFSHCTQYLLNIHNEPGDLDTFLYLYSKYHFDAKWYMLHNFYFLRNIINLKLVCLLICFCNRVQCSPDYPQTCYAAKDSLPFLIFLPPPLKSWDYSHMVPNLPQYFSLFNDHLTISFEIIKSKLLVSVTQICLAISKWPFPTEFPSL